MGLSQDICPFLPQILLINNGYLEYFLLIIKCDIMHNSSHKKKIRPIDSLSPPILNCCPPTVLFLFFFYSGLVKDKKSLLFRTWLYTCS